MADELNLTELLELDTLQAHKQTPIVDTSFSAASEQAFDMAVESEWSVSGYISGEAVRNRNERIDEMFRTGELDPTWKEKYQSKGIFSTDVDYDKVAHEYNVLHGKGTMLEERDLDHFRAEDMAARQAQFGHEMSGGDGYTQAGALFGGLKAGVSDPGMLAAGVLTAGVSVLYSGGARALASANAARQLGNLVETASTVRSVTRWQRALQLARPAALEGALSEAGLMMVNAENRERLGMDYTPEEVLATLGFGAGFGAAVGGITGFAGAPSVNKQFAATQAEAGKVVDKIIADGGKAGAFVQDMLDGVRDYQGRLLQRDLPPEALAPRPELSTPPFVGEPRWILDADAEETFLALIRERLPAPTEASPGMRVNRPPTRKEAKSTLPMGAWADGAYRGLSGRGVLRLIAGQDGWDASADVTPDGTRFNLFTSPERAKNKDLGSFVVRFNPDAVVGRMNFRAKDIAKQWEKGDVTFHVKRESRFQPEGRGDNFLADAIDDITVPKEIIDKAGSAPMKKMRKKLRQAGFNRVDNADGTVTFKRKGAREVPQPPDTDTLRATAETLEGNVKALMQSKELLKIAPPGAESLPLDYVIGRLQGAARRLQGVDLSPPQGRGVAEFEDHTGVSLFNDNTTPTGVPSEARRLEVAEQFDRMMKDNPNAVAVHMSEDADVMSAPMLVDAQDVINKQTAEADKLRAAMNTCGVGGA